MDGLATLAQRLFGARHVLVLSGAGLSAESGVPTFREAQTGLWARYDPLQLATPEAFAEHPERVWAWYRWRKTLVERASPNAAHLTIAAWSKRRARLTVATQNIDGLHQRAGLAAPIELHGSLARVRCTGCGTRLDWEQAPPDPRPRHGCGALLRPDVVWFGEALPAAELEAALAATRDCDLCLAIGTSGVVYPAAALPRLAAQHGAFVVEINPEDTPLSAQADLCIRLPAAVALAALERLERNAPA